MAAIQAKIYFRNVNIRTTSQFIAMNVPMTDWRLGPLYKLFPKRTSNRGFRSDVNLPMDNRDNWSFPDVLSIDEMKRTMVATRPPQSAGSKRFFIRHIF